MGFAIKVKMLLAAKEMTIGDLADKMEPKTTRQNIGAKLKRDNLTEKDLHDIAKACGVTFEGNFVLEDGRKI
ncbi:MAG: transcriptional regulator [Christensenellales bacterium]